MQTLFLTYPGVAGEVTVTGYEDLIACESFYMHTESGTLGAAQLGDRNESRRRDREGIRTVGIDSVSLTRKADKASPKLFQLACAKKDSSSADGETVKLTICRAFDKAPTSADSEVNWYEPFVNVTMKNAYITSHKLRATTEGMSEEISIGFKEITFEYITYQNGKKLGNVSVTVNIANPTSSA
ncbi:type VI secretion system tube protein Hcp [Radicibacter daui]|uniref:type VI secretion system tube protein Hcp n=1 Tax=Radicibacter daui TaxID=3064829 RepID=UPI004046B7BF